MGGWTFIRDEIEWAANHVGSEHARPKYTGRPPAAATATGLLSTHNREKEAFLSSALSDKPVEDSLVT
jgi:2-oxoglutarate dehydrogenase E1 component